MRDWDEDTLAAYLDGELDAETALALEEALAEDAELRREVERMSYVGGLFRAAATAQLRRPAPSALTDRIMGYQTATPRPRSSGRRWAVAAMLAVLAAGAAAGYAGYRFATHWQQRQFATIEAGRWLDEIAGYHRLYAAESRHLVEVPATEQPHIERWLGARLSRPLSVPDLAAADLQFKGARLLAINDKPVAQLMYQPAGNGPPVAEGRPIAVCITPTAEPDHGPRFTQRNGVGLLYWRRGGDAMVIAGWADEPRLRAWHTLVAPAIAPAP